MAWLAIAKASERHAACSGGCSGLPRARALSRVALRRAVIVGGVGTTSMPWSRYGSLDDSRAR